MPPLSEASLRADADRVAAIALEEDGDEDITTEVSVPANLVAMGRIEFRSSGVVAGQVYADAVVRACGLAAIKWSAAEGERLFGGAVIGTLSGRLAVILRAERPLLNLLQRASGIAGATRDYVDAVTGTGARILHTRKTAPGLRLLDVGAVVAGGGHTHRLDLADTVMIKDNHWRALEQSGVPLAAALDLARSRGVASCYVEVETESQLELACAAGASRLLVDNQTAETVRTWGQRARALRPGIEIEATGGITLDNVRRYAEAGADFISIGALTHSVRAADVALEVGGE